MPTSAPGSRRRRGRGFTLIELLIVIAIMAVGAAMLTWALPDGEASRLEEEGARLAALLDVARTEARVSGATVRWVPRSGNEPGRPDDGDPPHFRFVGLSSALKLPGRWLDPRTTAEIVGASTVLLGPEAILPPQRIVLRLADHRLELASDGLGAFAPAAPPTAGAPP
jgi:general secretion pathway protein H